MAGGEQETGRLRGRRPAAAGGQSFRPRAALRRNQRPGPACVRALSARALNVRARPSGGPHVDLALRDLGELLVGGLLLLEVLLEQLRAVIAAEPLRPCDQRAVARDLVV